jgi:3-isopropylmalate/(R)-2-methylmalate dehydratase small subunit
MKNQMTSKNIEGNVIKYEKENIDTDLIIPARYLNIHDQKQLSAHCMEDFDPDFLKKREKLNAKILVGGANFGCGSSREHAPIALKGSGIQCVISPSFARIFFRNAINMGLPIIEFEKINKINHGDLLEINFNSGILKNKSSSEEFEISKMPPFLQNIINMGGLVNYAKNKIKDL